MFLPKQNSAFGRSLVASLTCRRRRREFNTQLLRNQEPQQPSGSHLGDVGELEGADTIGTDGQVLRGRRAHPRSANAPQGGLSLLQNVPRSEQVTGHRPAPTGTGTGTGEPAEEEEEGQTPFQTS